MSEAFWRGKTETKMTKQKIVRVNGVETYCTCVQNWATCVLNNYCHAKEENKKSRRKKLYSNENILLLRKFSYQ